MCKYLPTIHIANDETCTQSQYAQNLWDYIFNINTQHMKRLCNFITTQNIWIDLNVRCLTQQIT